MKFFHDVKEVVLRPITERSRVRHVVWLDVTEHRISVWIQLKASIRRGAANGIRTE
uniref:Uncharacterized protein n=1 Tax=Kalanchoe fedtschenkoi TaxID=63787 RepID=A0A7N0U576_KALFE